MDYTSDMERTKNGGCVSHDEKKNIQNTKQQKNQCLCFNVIVLFEIKSMDLIKRGFMFNFLVIALYIISKYK